MAYKSEIVGENGKKEGNKSFQEEGFVYHEVYSEKFKSSVIVRYQLGEGDENESEDEEGRLESIIGEVEKQIEEKPEYMQNSLEDVVREIPMREKYAGSGGSYDSKIIHHDFRYNKGILYHSEEEKILSAIAQGFDPETGARIVVVPPDYLPAGENWRAVGMYVPSTNTIYLAGDLEGRGLIYTCAHEIEHAKGEFNEYLTDLRATARLGYRDVA